MDNQDKHLPGQQIEMDIFPVKEVEIEGVQMGVLNNGIPYLTTTGLSGLKPERGLYLRLIQPSY
ncbi:hypothetical protein [Xenorhabdus sp. SGI246]|uniref:hypothetical protein n=1 Tax=Xenorhabdus sp. SGI246 TaxID=3158263 RepID=UPI00349F7815